MNARREIGDNLDAESAMKALENVRRAQRLGLLTIREADVLCRTWRVAYRQDAGLNQFPEDIAAMQEYEADSSA